MKMDGDSEGKVKNNFATTNPFSHEHRSPSVLCHVKAFLSIELSAHPQPLRKISRMKGASGYAALAVLGLMLVAANAEVFFQEDFTGGCLRAVRCCCPLAPLRAVRARTHASCVARSTWR